MIAVAGWTLVVAGMLCGGTAVTLPHPQTDAERSDFGKWMVGCLVAVVIGGLMAMSGQPLQ